MISTATRKFVLFSAALSWALGSSTALWAVQPCAIPRERHPWGSFPAGSAKTVKITNETLDPSGKVVGTSEHIVRTVLDHVDDRGFELVVSNTIEVSGRRFSQEPQIVSQGFHGESEGAELSITAQGNCTAEVCGATVNARSASLQIRESDSQRTVSLLLSDDPQSRVLRRETRSTDSAGNVVYETISETIAQKRPMLVAGRTSDTWQTRTTKKFSQGTIVTDETHCAEVPGGVIAHSANEFDSAGKLVSRSRLEMLDFSVPPPDQPPRRRLFQRRANRRENDTRDTR